MSNKPKKSLFRRGVTLIGTIGVIAVAGVAVSVGSDTLAQRAAAAPAPDAAEITPVSVVPLQFADHYMVSRQFLGQVEATEDATLSFELSGQLATLAVDEGDSVVAGQIIARLDTALLEAEQARLEATRDATNAQLTFAESRLARATELVADGFSSEETRDQALATRDELLARLAEVDAGLAATQINLNKSVLRAPFDGRVGQRAARSMETLSPGQPVLTLIETATLRVRVGLPLDIRTESLFDITLTIGGQAYSATLDQIRPDIDPVTRTRTAIFAVDTADALTFGQTATLTIDSRVNETGVWVSNDALQEGIGSVWTVLVVADDTVRTAAVELLHSEADRAFVRGTFTEGMTLINGGAHRVVPGQQVRILMAGG
ncbi:MAG: efflux RND transporter periplasmic adaptor subunit [Pseudomonadota bacterium]